MDGVSEVSVAFWLKGSTAQSGELWCPISWGHTGTAGMVMQATNIHGAHPHMAFHVSPGGPPPGSATVTMPINIADGQWHHIVFTRSARRASGFLDGVYTGSLTLPDDSADLSPVRMVDGFMAAARRRYIPALGTRISHRRLSRHYDHCTALQAPAWHSLQLQCCTPSQHSSNHLTVHALRHFEARARMRSLAAP